MDLRNAISLAAMVGGLFDDDEEMRRSAPVYLSVDTASYLLEKPVHAAFVDRDEIFELREERLSPTTRTDETQRRSIQLLIATTASGELQTTIVIIKDHDIKTFASHVVSLFLI